MSAEFSARAVSETDKVDKVRALQRVLYRSAKQEPNRRFHALYDKVARSDILWRAWADVARNQGAPGVDGVTITSIADGGVPGVRAFLDGLAAKLLHHGKSGVPAWCIFDNTMLGAAAANALALLGRLAPNRRTLPRAGVH